MFEVKEENVILPLDNPEEVPIGVRIASKFSVAEQNIVCIYKKNNKYETIQAITWSIPYVNDEDMIALNPWLRCGVSPTSSSLRAIACNKAATASIL